MRIGAMVVALLLAGSALAQGGRPVRFVVPFPAGSLPDQIARVIGPQLQDSLGQSFVIENRPGAIGVIGTAEAARAAPDGHTIVMTTNSTLAAAGSLFKKLQYDPLRGLGVTSAQRTPLAPDIPAIAEEIPGYEVVLWYGLVAPAGTPREALNRVYEAVRDAMAKPEFKARFAAFGVDPAPLGPEAFAGYIRSEIDKWSRDIKQAGIEPE